MQKSNNFKIVIDKITKMFRGADIVFHDYFFKLFLTYL